MAMKREKKTKSMRTSLVRIVVLCWIIPVIGLTFVLSFMAVRNISLQIRRNAANTVYAAAETCVDEINAALSASRYASYNTTISTAYHNFRLDENFVNMYRDLDTFLTGNYQFDNKFMLTYLRFNDNGEEDPLSKREFYTFNEALFPEASEAPGQNMYNEFLEGDAPDLVVSAKDLGTSIGFENRDGKLYLVRNLYLSGKEPTAVFIQRLNITDWFGAILNTPWSTEVALALNGEEIAVMGEGIDVSVVLSDGRQYGGDLSNAITYEGSLYFSGNIAANDYTLSYAVKADEGILLREANFLRIVLLLSSLAVIPLLIIVLRYFYKHISRPIDRLVVAAEEINQGNFGYQAECEANSSEFIRLNNSFNEMSSQLQEQFEQIFREELALRDAKIMALQSQINPHFLGNTLEIINWEARLGNSSRVTKMIESLSTMLDAALDRNKKPIIHLSEELMYVDAYLYIIGERLGKRLAVEKNIDESLLGFNVPRLILQPIIENAVDHGISPAQHGKITIIIRKDEASLYLEIENDGVLTAADIEKISEMLDREDIYDGMRATHVGIRNVNERIKIIYGEGSGLTIKMTDKGTVLAQITIPFGQTDNDMQ